MKNKRLARQSQTSSALVITLLGVVILTIIVVAFMQTMSLSLTTAKSYADLRRATLAAQAGLDTALAQLTLATGTNLAFVTGQTNFAISGTTPVGTTVIATDSLTNSDHLMPLVSGPMTYLTNFSAAGFSANFNNYTAALLSGTAGQTIDVNVYTGNTASPYPLIQETSDTNMYRAAWVTMTNQVGSQTLYTRYAYVVLDDTARINPALMAGSGTGYTNPTNWYAGPQDINALALTNSGAPVLTAAQMLQLTNAATSNSFSFSDATLGETFTTRANYEAVKHLFTSRSNPSFDVIPAWIPAPYGKQPKYNINDLATNTAYGLTPVARAANIANIISGSFPNFCKRDPGLYPTNTTLYINRLAANIVTYISPDGTWPASEYTTNTTGISPQVYGVFPVAMNVQSYATAGGYSTTLHSSGTFVIRYWLSFWNPHTTPVPLTNVVLHVYHAPEWALGDGTPTTATTDYSGTNTFCSEASRIAQPNEFVTLGFLATTNTVTSTTPTYNSPGAIVDTVYNGGDAPPLQQFSVTINGQTVAQTVNQPNYCGMLMDPVGAPNPPTNFMVSDSLNNYGKVVGDPRFQNYGWSTWPSTHDEYSTECSYNGYPNTGGSALWNIFPAPAGANTWVVRDNIARAPAFPGSNPINNIPNGAAAPWTETPDQLPNVYKQSTDSNAAPEVFRNGPMVSIGELGHVFDPSYASDALTSLNPRADGPFFGGTATVGGGPFGNYLNGGGRSLRIGRPESNGAVIANGSATSSSWDVNGERAINLLDLFTVNNANTNSTVPPVTNSIKQSLNYGGALGRINPNTASSNLLAAVFSGIKIASDPGMTNSSGSFMSPLVLTNVPTMVQQFIANRPYSSLSDLYTNMPLFDTTNNYYSPSSSSYLNTNYAGYMNVFNRVHQEAFGKLVQHLTVQSRSYRVFVIGQVLDSSRNPHGSVAMEAGIYLQYHVDPTGLDPAGPRYEPVIQYVRLLK
jgi:Tfp pilus assembly protein PilX